MKVSKTSEVIDFKSLFPGARLRMRDWRDKSLVDTTFYAFQATRNIVLATGSYVREKSSCLYERTTRWSTCDSWCTETTSVV